MTADEFRALALSLPGTVESSHMGHPDFRVGGKIFATLGPDEEWGMVKLTPAQQEPLLRGESESYRPAAGAWGVKGATLVTLDTVDVQSIRASLLAAWRNTAPKRLAKEYDALS